MVRIGTALGTMPLTSDPVAFFCSYFVLSLLKLMGLRGGFQKPSELKGVVDETGVGEGGVSDDEVEKVEDVGLV